MASLVGLSLLLLALCRAPVFALLGAAALAGFAALPDTPLSGVANDVFSERFADSPLLVTIPMFTFAGVLLAETSASRRLVEVSRSLLGWLPGGLPVVCIFASALFTTFTGGSGITIVAIGGLLLPALLEEKYPEPFSLGLVTTGGSLGLLLPPSLPMIIYGVVASLDIESLFIAAFVPGLITLGLLAVYAALTWKRSGIAARPFDARAARRALWTAKWEVALPVALTCGLGSGALRIHEAAAFTALYVLLVELCVYRELRLADVPRIVRKCITLVGAILIVMATATGLTAYLIQANIPQAVVGTMQSFISSKWVFLLFLNVFLILAGMLMEVFAALIVIAPLIGPVASHFGVNPYHLGTIFLLNLEIGYLMPPVGLNLLLSSFRFERPMFEVCRAVAPFAGVLLLSLGIVTYAPGLSLWSSRLVLPLHIGSSVARTPPAPEDDPVRGAGAARSLPAGQGDAPAPSDTLDVRAAREETLDELLQKAGSEPPAAPEPPALNPPGTNLHPSEQSNCD